MCVSYFRNNFFFWFVRKLFCFFCKLRTKFSFCFFFLFILFFFFQFFLIRIFLSFLFLVFFVTFFFYTQTSNKYLNFVIIGFCFFSLPFHLNFWITFLFSFLSLVYFLLVRFWHFASTSSLADCAPTFSASLSLRKLNFQSKTKIKKSNIQWVYTCVASTKQNKNCCWYTKMYYRFHQNVLRQRNLPANIIASTTISKN